jgi:hypothetical protein
MIGRRTGGESSETYAQPVQGRGAVLGLGGRNVDFFARHPGFTDGIEELWEHDLDVGAFLCDIGILWGAGLANDQMGDLHGKIEESLSAEGSGDAVDLVSLVGGERGAADDGPEKRRLAVGQLERLLVGHVGGTEDVNRSLRAKMKHGGRITDL